MVVLLRSIGLICSAHRAVVLEKLALRQQLAMLTRARQRPQLRARDRLFWVALARAWRGWRTAPAIRRLVNQMGIANPLWGAPRIHGELGKLGIDVSERTVSRLLRRRRRPPSQMWHTFLTNHLTSLVSLDFFTVPTLTGRVLFVLVPLSHRRLG